MIDLFNFSGLWRMIESMRPFFLNNNFFMRGVLKFLLLRYPIF
jgi:hypothetical protein